MKRLEYFNSGVIQQMGVACHRIKHQSQLFVSPRLNEESASIDS